MLPLLAALLSGCSDQTLPTGPVPRAASRDVQPGTCVVTNTNDNGSNSLRAAIANAACTTITFDPTLNGQTITLTTGQLAIGRDLALKGPGSAQLSIVRSSAAGTPEFRIVDVPFGKTVSISGVTISGGKISGSNNVGGGILNSGALTLSDVTVSNNSAADYGGGIYSVGGLTVVNSTISGNTSGFVGGGVVTWFTSFYPGPTFTGTTISNNTARGGGGLANEGSTLTLTNSTVSGNTADDPPSGGVGGGISVHQGTVTLDHVTVSANLAKQQGGGIGVSFFDGSTLILRGSIVAGNTEGPSGFGRPDISGHITANYSLIGNSNGVFLDAGANNVGGPANLGPLQNNGGPTFTHALLAGSNAINKADNASCPAVDQRGYTRALTAADVCDIGAYEAGAVPPAATTTTLTSSPNPATVGATVTFTATVTSNSAPVTTGTVNIINGGTCSAPTSTLASSLSLDASGVATFSTSTLAAGTQTITACYGGATGFAASSGTTSQEIDKISTTTSLAVSPTTQQYSDNVGLTATISPSTATGSVQFKRSTDGGLNFTNIGASVAVASGSASLTYQVGEAAGTAERFEAIFTATGAYDGSTSGAQALTITKENATIVYGSGNPAALQVSSAGGSLNAGALTLLFSINETSPDLAAATAAPGGIVNAGLSVTLAPVGPGSSVNLTCTAGAVTGTGYNALRPFSCTNAAAISVNTYEVQASVSGNYYTGSYSDALTVFDPSLGFVSGGGSFVLDGDPVTMGFTTKYGKSGSNLQGNLIVVRHHADGTVSQLKANALGSLALGQDATVPMGWATLNGKATYTYWDANIGDYAIVGNQSFAMYAEDRNNPGTAADRIWLGGPADLSMPGTLFTAAANTVPLTRGNISIPHAAQGSK